MPPKSTQVMVPEQNTGLQMPSLVPLQPQRNARKHCLRRELSHDGQSSTLSIYELKISRHVSSLESNRYLMSSQL